MTKPITPLDAKRECEAKFTNGEIEILNGLILSGYATVAEHASPEFFIDGPTITKLLSRNIYLRDLNYIADMYTTAGWFVTAGWFDKDRCYKLFFRCPND